MVDAQTFLVPNFSYDGTAPDAHFWVGKGTSPGPEGISFNREMGIILYLRVPKPFRVWGAPSKKLK